MKKNRWVAIVLLIGVVGLFAPGKAWASRMNPNTDWMTGKLGIFNHCLFKSNEFARVSAFDVKGFAEQIIAAKPDFYVITLGQNTGYYCSPNDEYERAGALPKSSRCSARDIPGELIALLKPHGIKIGLYLPCQPAVSDTQTALRMGFRKELNKGNRNFTAKGVESWSRVLEVWARRYAGDVSLWWFDGAYVRLGFKEAIGQKYAAIVKKYNPKAVVAFNRDVGLNRYIEADDYTAGELNDPFEVKCEGRWIDEAQWQAFSFMGSSWTAKDVRYTEKEWVDWAAGSVKAGGAVMLDLGIDFDTFRISEPQLKVFKAIGKALGR